MIYAALSFGNVSAYTEVSRLAAGRSTGRPLELLWLSQSPQFSLAVDRLGMDISGFERGADQASRSWLLGDCNAVPGYASEHRNLDFAALEKSPPRGRWLAVKHIASSNELELYQDYFGLLGVFVVHLTDRVLLSCDFGALARSAREHVSLDVETFLMELSFGHSQGGYTVFREIQQLAPGAKVSISAGGGVKTQRPVIRYGTRHAAKSQKEKFALLDAHYRRMTERIIEPARENLGLSLSAGYDSRFILAHLEKYHMRCPMMTFGHPLSDEVIDAGKVAQTAGYSIEQFPIPESDWAQWMRSISFLGSAGIVQWSGWAESWLSFARTHASRLAIGYVGDTITGKRHPRLADGAWPDRWFEWNADDGWAYSPMLREDARALIAKTMRERCQEELAYSNVSSEFQTWLHINLYGRQRRWVGAQQRLAGLFVCPVLFFYDPEYFDFWANVGFEDLFDQKLYLDYGKDRFPHLFPANTGRSPSLLERVGRKMRRMLTGERSGPKPIVINKIAMINGHQRSILSLVDALESQLAEIFDLDSVRRAIIEFPNDAKLDAPSAIRLTNALILLNARNALKSNGI